MELIIEVLKQVEANEDSRNWITAESPYLSEEDQFKEVLNDDEISRIKDP